MEVDEKPTENYGDIGGLDKQIEELVEAIVLPMKQADKFKSLGIKAPKGALMYGPPGPFCFVVGRGDGVGADAVVPLQEPERPSLLVPVLLKPTPVTSNLLAHPSSKSVQPPPLPSLGAHPRPSQMFIGDGAKLVRDAFELAKEKAPTIIFIGSSLPTSLPPFPPLTPPLPDRRARRDRHEAVRQRQVRRPRSPTHDARTPQPTRRLRE